MQLSVKAENSKYGVLDELLYINITGCIKIHLKQKTYQDFHLFLLFSEFLGSSLYLIYNSPGPMFEYIPHALQSVRARGLKCKKKTAQKLGCKLKNILKTI